MLTLYLVTQYFRIAADDMHSIFGIHIKVFCLFPIGYHVNQSGTFVFRNME